jgi:hypothetical protein
LRNALSGICLALVFQAVALGQTASSTVLAALPSPSNYGQPVTLTATVTSGATGKVTFYDGVTILGIGTISGTQASITTVMLPSGNRKLRTYYQGDGTYRASSSASVPQSVVAGASMGFQPPATYSMPAVVGSVAVGDFNGDNRQDLVMASTLGNTITVYLGNGDGTFQTGVDYNVGTIPESVAVGDFNGDGRMDLAVANDLTNNVSILLGNGDGTFQAAVNYPAGNQPTALGVADLNGDGIADLVVANWTATGIAVLLGNGDGTFQDAISIAGGGFLGSVAVADFNGDGQPDLLVTSQGPAIVRVLLGNGDGTFGAPQIVYTSSTDSVSVGTADFNGDGQTDLFVVMNYSLAVLLGNGDGSFGAPVTTVPAVGYYASNAVAADFEGDGKEDLAVISVPEANIYLTLLPGNGDGTFGAPKYLLPAFGYLLVPGDFNGDGKIDLAMAQSASNPQFSYGVTLGGGVPATVPITIQTDPDGLQFSVDGGAAQTAPQTLNLTPGTHTLTVASPQAAGPGAQYTFIGWSDAGSASHPIVIFNSATYNASFALQYQLTANANPPAGGSITPASGTYLDSGPAGLTAIANPPYTFKFWGGATTSIANLTSINMSAPESVTAYFALPAATCAAMGDSVPDLQRIVNEALGVTASVDDLNLDGVVNVVDVQALIATAFGLGCLY